MRVLKLGVKGSDVKSWQLFLIGQGFQPGPANGEFGEATRQATAAFQHKNKLDGDGAAGNQTIGKAMMLGFVVLDDDDPSKTGPNFPAKPAFPPLSSNAARQKVFGKFAFVAKPLPDNPENILITDNWERDNIVSFPVPQLIGVKGAPASGKIRFHRLAQPPMEKLWAAWAKAGLLDRVLGWSGSFVPRFVRGSTTVLSNHSFGSAFDINVPFNPLGAMPALVGQKGCVRELVPIANGFGFYWGGHFDRLDGMHFEIAFLK